MRKAAVVGGVIAIFVVLIVLAARQWAIEQADRPAAAAPPEITTKTEGAEAATPEDQPGFLFGRVSTIDGTTFEGRLRWGGDEEAFWGDYFNGVKNANPWAGEVPPERLPKEREEFKIFGHTIGDRETKANLDRLFMARFGDIARIEARGRDVRVTLKSGTVFDLGRMEASDFDDGVRVWDGKRGVLDLDSLRVSAIELLPTAPLSDAPLRLHGTVRTRQGDFTGFVQWDRTECVGTDELRGRTADGDLTLRFDTIRSIVSRPGNSSVVTLVDGREVGLSLRHNRGIYVDDRRYGRVLISWNSFGRLDFTPGGSGPAYGDFPPGRKLTGSVTTRDGRRLTGRLVYDLDESETTETLDAPSLGVDYTIPFEKIAAIVPAGSEASGAERATVKLHSGEELQFESAGDLGERNAGVLVFVDGGQHPEYLSWTEVERIDFDSPPSK